MIAYPPAKPLTVCPFSRFERELLERVERVSTGREPMLVWRPEGRSFVVMGIRELHAIQAAQLDIIFEQAKRDRVNAIGRAKYRKKTHQIKP